MNTDTLPNHAGRPYVGLAPGGTREVFRAVETPSQASHGQRFAAVIGPFRTVRGARFMAEHGRGNPHCQTVNDAEHIARGEAYDLVLRQWVKLRAVVVRGCVLNVLPGEAADLRKRESEVARGDWNANRVD